VLAVAVGAGIAGCGDGTRILLGDGPTSGGHAAPPDGGPRVDGTPFGAPQVVAELGSAGNNDFKETLTADRLEIYFVSNRPGGPGNQDIWTAVRASTADPWGIPTCVLELSSPSTETGAAVSGDGLTIWLGSSRAGGKGGVDIWVSTRAARGMAWSTPSPVAELNTPNDEFPRPTAQGGLLMLPSYRGPPNNKYQTFTTSRPALDATWASPTAVTEVDTSGINTDAFLDDQGLLLYFSSDRLVATDQDLYVARRTDVGSAFTDFQPITELNTAGHAERDPWLSSDQREIYFSSDRGDGTLKIYRATR